MVVSATECLTRECTRLVCGCCRAYHSPCRCKARACFLRSSLFVSHEATGLWIHSHVVRRLVSCFPRLWRLCVFAESHIMALPSGWPVVFCRTSRTSYSVAIQSFYLYTTRYVCLYHTDTVASPVARVSLCLHSIVSCARRSQMSCCLLCRDASDSETTLI